MELTGWAGQIVGGAILLVAYAIILSGLYVIVYWVLIEWIGQWVLKATKTYDTFIQWIYHRKEFKKWLKQNKEITP